MYSNTCRLLLVNGPQWMDSVLNVDVTNINMVKKSLIFIFVRLLLTLASYSL